MKSAVIKLNLMFLALVGILYVMYLLNKDGLNPDVQEAMGFGAPPVEQQGKITYGRSLSWCAGKVMRLSTSKGFVLYQQDGDWFGGSESIQQFKKSAVDRWFGEHCTLAIHPTKAEGTDEPALKVEYTGGTSEVFTLAPKGIFTWKGQSFQSVELAMGLYSLTKLPVVKPE